MLCKALSQKEQKGGALSSSFLLLVQELSVLPLGLSLCHGGEGAGDLPDLPTLPSTVLLPSHAAQLSSVREIDAGS